MKPLRLPWRGHDVPSALLDVIRGCNCVCKACFNRCPPRVKPLDEIEAELEIILRSRAVESIGISGGEPLLHPRIMEIIQRVRACGVVPTLLTNGILWTEEVAAEAARAGLGVVIFHVQPGQKRADAADGELAEKEAESLVREKCAIAVRHGIEGAVISTRNVHRPGEIDAGLRAFRANPHCSLVWMTLERAMQTIDAGEEVLAAGNGVDDMSKILARHGWLPFAGIGGLFRPSTWRWMAYHGYARMDKSGHETAFTSIPPSLLEKFAFALAKLFGWRIPARMHPSRAALVVRLTLNALLGGRFRNLAFAWGALLKGERIVPRHVIVEALPDLLPDGRIERCDPCMDATVVNGRLVSPCLVDTAGKGADEA